VVEFCSATAVWRHGGMPVVPIRWVLLRDPLGRFSPQALLCTDPARDPLQIIRWFILRWQVEVTFQEARTHLGVETRATMVGPCCRSIHTLLVRAVLDRDPAGRPNSISVPERLFSAIAGTASRIRPSRILSRPCGGTSGVKTGLFMSRRRRGRCPWMSRAGSQGDASRRTEG
jgi:hypothetical protein